MLTLFQLVDGETGQVVVETLELADQFWSRLVGWQFRRRPSPRHGVLLVPCSSVHTCFLRFPIDVGLLDRGGRIVAVHTLKPWRTILPVSSACAVLEMPSGGSEMRPGQRLQLRIEEGTNVPKSLRFLDKR